MLFYRFVNLQGVECTPCGSGGSDRVSDREETQRNPSDTLMLILLEALCLTSIYALHVCGWTTMKNRSWSERRKANSTRSQNLTRQGGPHEDHRFTATSVIRDPTVTEAGIFDIITR